MQAAAREANALIDRRTFSWTELLNQFQATLPPDVRIAGVTPQSDDRRAAGWCRSRCSRKRIEDLEAFMDALEKTGAFSGVLPRSEQPDESGTHAIGAAGVLHAGAAARGRNAARGV